VQSVKVVNDRLEEQETLPLPEVSELY